MKSESNEDNSDSHNPTTSMVLVPFTTSFIIWKARQFTRWISTMYYLLSLTNRNKF